MNKKDHSVYFGEKATVVNISKLTVTDGNVIAADPLVGIYNDMPAYTQHIPSGTYDVSACIIKKDSDVRIAAVEVKFSSKAPETFILALDGTEDPEEVKTLSEDDFFGFPVDAGLAAIFDKTSLKAFMDYQDKWYEDNPDGEFYDDHLAKLFEESYKNHPDTQRSAGDYIDCIIPGTEYHIPMCASGYGDGYYPVYFGFSGDDEICCMMILFIDISDEEA